MSDIDPTALKDSRSFRHSLVRWFHLHKEKLWWLHSLYALILGIGIMWLGKQNFAYLRWTVFHICFIWLSSLFLPKLLAHPSLPLRWAPRVRLLINLFNKNLYQQTLFFILPIYYASSTLGSGNVVFVLLVGLSATLSTLDVIYDRHLSMKRSLVALFFAFSFFALINVMLPVLWSVSNTVATRVSALLALVGFLTFYYRRSQSKIRVVAVLVLVGIVFFTLVEWGRPFIPPAPLRLVSVEFGRTFNRASKQVGSRLTELPPERSLRVYGVTAIKAPLGLKDRVRHRWYRDGKLACTSPLIGMTGGREEGFRLWTSCHLEHIQPGTSLRLELETAGGQLIGRARLKAGK